MISQPSTASSPTEPLPSHGLHPILGAALQCLEIDLDAELKRYRKSRTPDSESGVAQPSPDDSDRTSAAVPVSPSSETEMESLDTAASPELIIPPSDPMDAEAVEQPITSPLTTSATLESLTPEPVSFPSPENADFDQLWSEAAPVGPEDYLASSEELLKSLATEDATPVDSQSLPVSAEEPLLLPVVLGASLALLVAMIALGFLVFVPVPQKESEPSRQKSGVPGQMGHLAALPMTPNLAVEEFQNLGNGSLSTLVPLSRNWLSTIAAAKPESTVGALSLSTAAVAPAPNWETPLPESSATGYWSTAPEPEPQSLSALPPPPPLFSPSLPQVVPSPPPLGSSQQAGILPPPPPTAAPSETPIQPSTPEIVIYPTPAPLTAPSLPVEPPAASPSSLSRPSPSLPQIEAQPPTQPDTTPLPVSSSEPSPTVAPAESPSPASP